MPNLKIAIIILNLFHDDSLMNHPSDQTIFAPTQIDSVDTTQIKAAALGLYLYPDKEGA